MQPLGISTAPEGNSVEHAPVDILWVLVSAALVFLMQAGFLCVESGLTRTKNSINVAVKNMADLGLSLLAFWAFGFALMFGASRLGWVGGSHFLVGSGLGDGNGAAGDSGAWLLAFFLFQSVFCGTAVTIVSGAVAERVRFGGYLLMAAVVAGVVYPTFGHWAWGGALDASGGAGWLASIGFVDFAGSTVVHSVGGWAALAGVLVLGPRIGRFEEGRPAREVPASNLPLAMLGAMLLWFGWIGFNGGSTLAADGRVPLIVVNTMLAGAAGLAASLAVGRVVDGYVHPGAAVNGPLAGLVAITAGCHAVDPPAAALVGAAGACCAFAATKAMERLRVDDAVSAVPVHLAAGAWGTLAVGLLGDPERLGTGLTWGRQVGAQALGVAACGAFTFAACYAAFRLAALVGPLRVTAAEEADGLNVSEHRASTELIDFARTIERQAETGDLSIRAAVEPFTEVGQIARCYNKLMAALQRSKTDVTHLERSQADLRRATREARALAGQARAARDVAERADRAKGEFLANMSHEIRTPLHAILSFAGFGIRRAEAEPHKVRGYCEKIDASGRRLLDLVNNLLDLSKLDAGRMTFDFQRLDLAAAVACVADEFTSLLSERGLAVRFVRPADPVLGDADRTRYLQVVRNLLGNAAKFAPPGSEIDVLLEDRAGRVELTVRDRGPGVPEAERRAIFEKFVQSSATATTAGGTGLGLSIVAEIVKGHGGRVWVENHPDGGAVFRVVTPAVLAPAAASTTEADAGAGQIVRHPVLADREFRRAA